MPSAKTTSKKTPKRWPYHHDSDMLVGQLTAIFVWQGYTNVKPGFSSAELDAAGGVIGIAQEVAQYSRFLALELQDYLKLPPNSYMAKKLESEGWPGVFEYEVAEPFGAWLREQDLTVLAVAARAKAHEMIKAFFRKD